MGSAASFPPFAPHLDVLGLVVGLAVAYEYGIRRLAGAYAPHDEDPVSTRQRLLFWSGLGVILVVSSWPIHDLGEQRLYLFHMVEHLGMALVAPPLLLAGTPWWLLRALLRPVLPAVRVVTRPLIALVAFNVWLAVIHLPGVVDLMLRNEVFHLVSHIALFGTALLMWWPVMDPIPDTRSLTPIGKMGYIFAQSLVPTIPASFMTLGTTPLYEVYETFPRMWGIDALTDQVVAGLMMKIGGGLVLWAFIAWVFFSWYAEEQRSATPPLLIRSDDASR